MRGCMGRISGLAGTVTTENRSPSYTPAIKNTGIPATWNSTSPCGDGSQIPRVGTRQRRARDQNPLPCFSCSKSFSLRALKTGLLPVGGGKPHNRVRHSMPPAPPTMTGAAPLGQTGSTVSPLGKPARRPAFHDDRAATTSASVNGWNSCMCVAPLPTTCLPGGYDSARTHAQTRVERTIPCISFKQRRFSRQTTVSTSIAGAPTAASTVIAVAIATTWTTTSKTSRSRRTRRSFSTERSLPNVRNAW